MRQHMVKQIPWTEHQSGVQHPVEASSAEVAAEVAAVRRAATPLCVLEVALDRVIASPTGNVLACWQVLGGSEPADVRRHAPAWAPPLLHALVMAHMLVPGQCLLA